MAAKKGNKYWMLRSKHGRDKIFSSPEDLWDAACEYFQSVIDNPITKTEITEKPNGKEVKTFVYTPPFLWVDFANFVGISTWEEYKTNEKYKDFYDVITRIDNIIYSNKFKGAAVGLYNSNIIARDLGLRDKSEVEQKGEVKIINLGAGVNPDNETTT